VAKITMVINTTIQAAGHYREKEDHRGVTQHLWVLKTSEVLAKNYTGNKYY